MKLAARGQKLYYSMPAGIFVCGFDGNGQKQFLAADTSQGYVYGMKLTGMRCITRLLKWHMQRHVRFMRAGLMRLIVWRKQKSHCPRLVFPYNGRSSIRQLP